MSGIIIQMDSPGMEMSFGYLGGVLWQHCLFILSCKGERAVCTLVFTQFQYCNLSLNTLHFGV